MICTDADSAGCKILCRFLRIGLVIRINVYLYSYIQLQRLCDSLGRRNKEVKKQGGDLEGDEVGEVKDEAKGKKR